MLKINCFKAYDIRGSFPDELNEEIAYFISRGFIEFSRAKNVVIGMDIRLSSQKIKDAVIQGITDSESDVTDIGIVGTEVVSFSTSYGNFDGGIMVTASHNPKDYNGMKLLIKQSKPISEDTGLKEIKKIAEKKIFPHKSKKGVVYKANYKNQYINKVLSFIDIDLLKPIKIVVNAGNGVAGPIVDILEGSLPFEFIKINHNPDGNFPNDVPNPMIEKNRLPTSNAVLQSKADLGIAWDADHDRCFFFDENGKFIDSYYIVGLLSEFFLNKKPDSNIIYDPRLIWNTLEIIKKNKGKAIQCKSGHAFIKQKMRDCDAIYGGEISAHHYFKDFYYCDSGMIPWLIIAQIMSSNGKKLSELVKERINLYPTSGEINLKVEDTSRVFNFIEKKYSSDALSINKIDGLSLEFKDWRFNLRSSNTEPLIRLNIETKKNLDMLHQKYKQLLNDII
tara:strand:- start:3032 stop:4378 length:1347 start_codon:yes stop_codon:yes gene_type:complete